MNYALDIEVFLNYFLIVLYCTDTKEFWKAQLWNDRGMASLKRMSKKLSKLKKEDVVYTYNGIEYDLPVMSYALEEARSNEDIYKKSVDTIDAEGWEHRMYSYLNFTHIDLMELLNLNRRGGRVSLKKAAAILGFGYLRDLPKDPHLEVESGEPKSLVEYCKIDCMATAHIAEWAQQEAESRRILQKELYPELDFTTRGRPRVGKMALVEEYKKQTGCNIYSLKKDYWGNDLDDIYKKMSSINMRFKDFLAIDYKFTSPGAQELYEKVISHERKMWYGTKAKTSEHMFEHSFEIAGKHYLMKEGGLHDEIGPGVWKRNGNYKIFNLDAKSFYPFIIKEFNISPVYAPDFGRCIGKTTDFRIDAKSKAKKCEFDSEDYSYWDQLSGAVKIIINAGFGQFGDMWSPFFDPRCVLQTTINGQLMLIMAIDWLTHYIGGIEVVQANTDGIMVKCPNKLEGRLRKAVDYWEKKTRMVLEVDELGMMVKRNANSYMEIDLEGNLIKGAKEFNTTIEPSRSRSNEIIKECLIAYYKDGKKPEQVIEECDDIHQFLTVVSAKGAVNYFRIDGSQYAKMQKTLRYYQAVNGGELGRLFTRGKNINSWPNASSVRVPLDIPDPSLKNFPDLNRDWYIQKAYREIEETLKG